MANGKRWTQAEVMRFRELYDDGLSFAAIGEELGRTYGALEKAKRDNFPGPQRGKRDWDDKTLEKLIQLFKDGVPASVAGLIIGRSKNAVIGKWHRMGLKRHEGNPAIVKNIRKAAKAKRRVTLGLSPQPKITRDNVSKFGGGISHTVGRPLSDIADRSCRFTVASHGTKHLMCGAPGYPWCRQHQHVVYRESK